MKLNTWQPYIFPCFFMVFLTHNYSNENWWEVRWYQILIKNTWWSNFSVSKFWWFWVADTKLEEPQVIWCNTDALLKIQQSCKKFACCIAAQLAAFCLSYTVPTQEEGLFKVGRKLHPVCYWMSSFARDAFSLVSVVKPLKIQLTQFSPIPQS